MLRGETKAYGSMAQSTQGTSFSGVANTYHNRTADCRLESGSLPMQDNCFMFVAFCTSLSLKNTP